MLWGGCEIAEVCELFTPRREARGDVHARGHKRSKALVSGTSSVMGMDTSILPSAKEKDEDRIDGQVGERDNV